MCKDPVRTLVETLSNASYSEEEYHQALWVAKEKLNHIITTYGDEQGRRTTPDYLANLVAEIIMVDRFSNYCTEQNMLHNKERARLHKQTYSPKTIIL